MTEIPASRCSQVNHEVRNGLVAVIYYTRLLTDKAKERGFLDIVAFDPDMAKTIRRLEKALTMCKNCDDDRRV